MADLTPSQFKDNTGKVWTFNINIGTIELVHAATNVSLYQLLDDKCKPLADLLGNMPAFANVCYILCGVDAAGVERMKFLNDIKGDPFKDMISAFFEELTLFFPDARRRAAISQMTKAWFSFENQSLDHMTMGLNRTTPEELAKVVLTKMFPKTFGASPPSPKSNPRKSRG